MKVSMPHTGRRQEHRGRAHTPMIGALVKVEASFRPKITLQTKQEAKQTPGYGLEPGLNQVGRHVP